VLAVSAYCETVESPAKYTVTSGNGSVGAPLLVLEVSVVVDSDVGVTAVLDSECTEEGASNVAAVVAVTSFGCVVPPLVPSVVAVVIEDTSVRPVDGAVFEPAIAVELALDAAPLDTAPLDVALPSSDVGEPRSVVPEVDGGCALLAPSPHANARPPTSNDPLTRRGRRSAIEQGNVLTKDKGYRDTVIRIVKVAALEVASLEVRSDGHLVLQQQLHHQTCDVLGSGFGKVGVIVAEEVAYWPRRLGAYVPTLHRAKAELGITFDALAVEFEHRHVVLFTGVDSGIHVGATATSWGTAVAGDGTHGREEHGLRTPFFGSLR
jgi:hypothetical protein